MPAGRGRGVSSQEAKDRAMGRDSSGGGNGRSRDGGNDRSRSTPEPVDLDMQASIDAIGAIAAAQSDAQAAESAAIAGTRARQDLEKLQGQQQQTLSALFSGAAIENFNRGIQPTNSTIAKTLSKIGEAVTPLEFDPITNVNNMQKSLDIGVNFGELIGLPFANTAGLFDLGDKLKAVFGGSTEEAQKPSGEGGGGKATTKETKSTGKVKTNKQNEQISFDEGINLALKMQLIDKIIEAPEFKVLSAQSTQSKKGSDNA